MTIAEVYKKYKHLDKVLSDESFDGSMSQIIRELWTAIKQQSEMCQAPEQQSADAEKK